MPKGRHPVNALTPLRIRSLSTPGRYADGNGLYLVVDPCGAKRWLLRIVIQGRRRDIGLGSTRLVPLADAREQARAMRSQARAGGDPLEQRRAAKRVVPTFRAAATQVHESYTAGWRNAKHAAQWITTLEHYVFPELGDRAVNDISSGDILRVLSPIWLAKPETARRVRQRLSSVMDWTRAVGFVTGENPVDGVAKGLPRQRIVRKHHAALPYIQVPDFIVRLREAEAGEIVRLAFEFLILTAGRTGEVIGACWTEMDVVGRVWTVPAERMKARREHRVPLGDRAVEILRRAKHLSAGSPFVFPGASPEKQLSNMALLMLLRRMGDPITAHGFRSSFRDWAAEKTSFAREVCEMALAHTVRDKIEAAYRRSDLFEKRRQLMCVWERHACPTGSKIVRLSSL